MVKLKVPVQERKIPKQVILEVIKYGDSLTFDELYVKAVELGYAGGLGNERREKQKFRQYLSDNKLVGNKFFGKQRPLSASKKWPTTKKNRLIKEYYISKLWVFDYLLPDFFILFTGSGSEKWDRKTYYEVLLEKNDFDKLMVFLLSGLKSFLNDISKDQINQMTFKAIMDSYVDDLLLLLYKYSALGGSLRDLLIETLEVSRSTRSRTLDQKSSLYKYLSQELI